MTAQSESRLQAVGNDLTPAEEAGAIIIRRYLFDRRVQARCVFQFYARIGTPDERELVLFRTIVRAALIKRTSDLTATKGDLK